MTPEATDPRWARHAIFQPRNPLLERAYLLYEQEKTIEREDFNRGWRSPVRVPQGSLE